MSDDKSIDEKVKDFTGRAQDHAKWLVEMLCYATEQHVVDAFCRLTNQPPERHLKISYFALTHFLREAMLHGYKHGLEGESK